MTPTEPIQVKLGTLKNYGFYTPDSNTSYTMIMENKMTHNVLKILSQDNFKILMGMYNSQISEVLVKQMPNIAVDEYGESTTLNMLLNDLEIGELIVREYTGQGSCKNRITKLGQLFLKRNVKKA